MTLKHSGKVKNITIGDWNIINGCFSWRALEIGIAKSWAGKKSRNTYLRCMEIMLLSWNHKNMEKRASRFNLVTSLFAPLRDAAVILTSFQW